ncbi:MAG: hypothetical protein WA417_03565 [Stellaceae bacterium]
MSIVTPKIERGANVREVLRRSGPRQTGFWDGSLFSINKCSHEARIVSAKISETIPLHVEKPVSAFCLALNIRADNLFIRQRSLCSQALKQFLKLIVGYATSGYRLIKEDVKFLVTANPPIVSLRHALNPVVRRLRVLS